MIEVFVVLIIIGILAAMAAPSFQSTIERNRLKEALVAIQGGLFLAHSEAIKQGTTLYFNSTAGNDGAWCYSVNLSACDCSETDSTSADYCPTGTTAVGRANRIRTLQGANYATIDLLTTTSIEFEPLRGVKQAGAASIGVRSTNFSSSISISDAGLISTSDF